MAPKGRTLPEQGMTTSAATDTGVAAVGVAGFLAAVAAGAVENHTINHQQKPTVSSRMA